MTLVRTNHVQARMSQRGISEADVAFVCQHARVEYRTGVRFYFLGRRDIPDAALSVHGHLEGTTLIVAPASDGQVMITCYRDRGAIADIKRKSKRASRRCA